LVGMGDDVCYLEQYFPGVGIGVSILAHRGRICAAFQHQRVHERPHSGVGSYRVSTRLSSELVGACARVTNALGYTGLAMFEFRQNLATGAWILLEINARP